MLSLVLPGQDAAARRLLAHRATVVVREVGFAAPAGDSAAGPLPGEGGAAILPSGRIARPTGTNTVVGNGALAVTASPDGRFLLVLCDDRNEADLGPSVVGGTSLAVVDAQTMQVVDDVRAPGGSFGDGIAALRDPRDPGGALVIAAGGDSGAVDFYDLSADGKLVPDAIPAIAIPASDEPDDAYAGQSSPGTIVVGPDAKRVFVVDELGDRVAEFDPATRSIVGEPQPVGFFPHAATLGDGALIVANEGAMRYGRLAEPAALPAFRTPPGDPDDASSLTFLGIRDGELDGDRRPLAMDPTPDGIRDVGGAMPAAIAVMPQRPFAFVAMANVDRVQIVELGARPDVVGGTELRLYARGPYGTQPAALALSPNEKRLYVALAGIDAIAVLDVHDPRRPHRLGLIPTGWDPIALSLSADGRTLFVVNSKGTGGRSTLERIELGRLNLRRSTSLALGSLRRIVRAGDDPLVPQRFGTPSHVFRHVVQLSIGPATYDDVFGDLTSSTPAVDGAAVTPNLHALAHRFALAGNFYPALDPGAGRTLALAGITTLASRRALLARSGNGLGMQQDPEDYPRAGYLFNTLALAGKSFRDYGDLLDLSGYRVGADDDPPGLGGSYAFDVPALAALAGHVDLAYPASDPGISDGVRANEFVRDYEGLAARGRAPPYADVWLPGAAAAGGIAAEDRAIGQIVAAISHGPTWATTAIFIAPVAGGISENGDRLRGFALVVSPYARAASIEETHLSPESILKTEEEMLGLPALSLGDELATDLHTFLGPQADFAPFEGRAPAQAPESIPSE